VTEANQGTPTEHRGLDCVGNAEREQILPTVHRVVVGEFGEERHGGAD
jgi:hypothetical protein